MIDAPPSAVESEFAVIGAVLFSPKDCVEALDRLRPEHFHETAMQAVWGIIRDGSQHDPVIAGRRREVVTVKLMGDPDPDQPRPAEMTDAQIAERNRLFLAKRGIKARSFLAFAEGGE